MRASSGADDRSSGVSPGEARLTELMEEFQRRQRERPDMVVRPWWAPEGPEAVGRTGRRSAVGFIVEYCPHGVDSVELAVRRDRVRLDGPSGTRQASLELVSGWRLDGADVRCPELLANHLLSMADRLLGEAA